MAKEFDIQRVGKALMGSAIQQSEVNAAKARVKVNETQGSHFCTRLRSDRDYRSVISRRARASTSLNLSAWLGIYRCRGLAIPLSEGGAA